MKTLLILTLICFSAFSFAKAQSVVIERSTLSMASAAKSYVGQGLTRAYDNAENKDHLFRASSNSKSHLQVSVQTKNEDWSLSISAPEGKELTANTIYLEATRSGGKQPSISFSGCGRCSNNFTGSFVIHELVWGVEGEVKSLAIDFLQFDDGVEYAWIVGTIRYHSTFPAPDTETLKPKFPTEK